MRRSRALPRGDLLLHNARWQQRRWPGRAPPPTVREAPPPRRRVSCCQDHCARATPPPSRLPRGPPSVLPLLFLSPPALPLWLSPWFSKNVAGRAGAARARTAEFSPEVPLARNTGKVRPQTRGVTAVARFPNPTHPVHAVGSQILR